MPSQTTPYRVLFVCWGNICRSPAAENVFRHYLAKSDLDGSVVCDSAGTIREHEGNPPDRRMTETARRRGIELTGAARKIVPADLQEFDLILAMDWHNLDEIQWLTERHPTTAIVKLFCEYCTEHDEEEVPDPYYGGQAGFDRVLDLLEDGCRNLLKEIQAR